MKVQFINITKSDVLNVALFKLVSISRIEDTLGSNHSLWFANPSIWSDVFERRFIDIYYKTRNDKLLKEFPLKNRIFCSCFSSIRVCEAQWQMYSQDRGCICLNINQKVLLDELEKYAIENDVNIYIGKVEYQQTSTIEGALTKNKFLNNPTPFSFPNQESLIKLLLLKRNAFEYEHEIRIFIVKDNPDSQKGIHFKYSCNPSDLVSRVMLNPIITESFNLKYWLESSTSTITRYGPGLNFIPKKDSLGRTNPRVVFSHLYQYNHPHSIKTY